jgi:WD40 repeat protein/serine/threonine protein kinase
VLQEPIEQVVKGYELREQIGAGGYGVVYRAYQPLVGREVAVKIILPQYANRPEFIRRFESEAQLVARLEHPYIVPLYDYWRDPDGAFLVMRWLRGGSLHDALHNGPPSNEALGRLLDQIGGALAAAHRRGVVHRDLKPANILSDEDGNHYLADFGIAKDLGKRVSPYQTDATAVIGSPAYISPEQVKSEPITIQTDIYSLGVMLYEILTGQLPFQAPTPLALMFKHLNDPVPPIGIHRPDLSDAVNTVIQRATAKRPADRYPDVSTLVHELKQALAKGPAITGRLIDEQPAPTPSGEQTTSGAKRSTYETGILYLPTQLSEAVEAAIENPYKGLRAFQEADADDFFGREVLTQLLLTRLQEQVPLGRFLAVVGPSGSGKSSVVHAGLAPAIRRGGLPGSQNWFVVEMFPGAHPIEQLAQALLRVAVEPPNNLVEPLKLDENGLLRVVDQVVPGDDGTELVLVIDQFEELFTLVEDEAVRTHFLNSLITAVTDPYSRVRVIVTLRADFYDRPLLYTGFSELMRERTEVVLPLAVEELKQAIVRPAERNGLRVDGELVEAIINDVGEQPGALPLLQYALTEVFERRSGRTLTLTPYNASGGVLGALARRAEEIYLGLSVAQQAAARQLFLRLVTLGEGVEDTRRRVRRTELATMTNDEAGRINGALDAQLSASVARPASAFDAVIDVYSQYRLLTTDRDRQTRAPTVEVAHEALIRTWTRLREWLDASRDDLRIQRRLSTTAAEWEHSGEDRSFLASGARLEQFASWAAETHLALNAEERAYLDASLAARDAQVAAEAERATHEAGLERRSRSFLRALLAVALVAAVLGVGLSIYAFGQRQTALDQQLLALESANIAQQNVKLASTAQAQANQSADTAATAQAQAQSEAANAKRNAEENQNLALSAGAQAALNDGNTDKALALAVAANRMPQPLSQARSMLASAAYAPGTHAVFNGHTDAVASVAFSPDGKTAISGSDDTTLRLWDVATHQTIRTFEGHQAGVTSVAFSPDGKTVISGSTDKTMILWDVATGQSIRSFTGHDDEVKSVAFSPDGKTVLSGSADTTLKLWDVATGQAIRTYEGHTQEVNQVVFSPDGKTALSASTDTDLVLWDIATAKPIRRFSGHKEDADSVAFSPDGKTALSGSADWSMILWDVATGQPIRTFLGHTRSVYDVTFSPDGKTALSASSDDHIGVWDVATGQLIRFLNGHGATVKTIAISPDGSQALSASYDATLRLWDLNNGAQVRQFDGTGGGSATLSPDGQMALSNGENNTAILWDVASGQARHSLIGHGAEVTTVAFSPDGHLALSGAKEADGAAQAELILWNTDTAAFVRLFKGHTDDINAVVFSPDGKTALSAAKDKLMILWDVATGAQIRTFTGHEDAVMTVAISPDGKTALSGSADKTLMLWDLATGQILQTFKGHTASVRSVAFSPDGKTALSGGEDSRVILWDLTTGKPVRRFVQHTATVLSVAFSPDGKIALSGSNDQLIILWNIADAQILRIFKGHSGSVRTVMFTPDGHDVFSTSSDKSIRLWRVDSDADLLAWTQANRFVPPLTCEDKTNYRLDRAGCDTT